jgi:hypothetical protein
MGGSLLMLVGCRASRQCQTAQGADDRSRADPHGLSVPGGGSAQLEYSNWDRNGDSIPVTVSGGGSSQQEQLSDQG